MWCSAPYVAGLWWLWFPGTVTPEPVRVRMVGGEPEVEMIGHEDPVEMSAFKVGCRWMLAQLPQPPQ